MLETKWKNVDLNGYYLIHKICGEHIIYENIIYKNTEI